MLLLSFAFVFAIALEVGHFTLERTSYTSVECPPEALCTSVECPGGHSALGDILHSDTGINCLRMRWFTE